MKNIKSYAGRCLIFVITVSMMTATFLSFGVSAANYPMKKEQVNFQTELAFTHEINVPANKENENSEVSILEQAKEGSMASNASKVYSETAPDGAYKSILCGEDGEIIEIPVTQQYYKIGITLTDEELQLLYYVVDTEVVSGSVEHKMVIAQVIINRVRSSRFPNTVKSVITAPRQFSTAKSYYKKTDFKPSKKTVTAVQNVLSGEYPDQSRGALYFCNPKKVSTNWFETSLKKLFDMEGHRFYTYKA